MDESLADKFFVAMCDDAPEGDIITLDDAITYAMLNVRLYDGPRWFGEIAGGVVYVDTDRTLWFPDSAAPKAMKSLKVKLGEALTEGLACF